MRHPFSLDLSDLEPTQPEATLTKAEAEVIGGGRRRITWGVNEGGGVPKFPIATTNALGEEGGGPIDLSEIDFPKIDLSELLEQVKTVSPHFFATTNALGEEGGGYFSH